MKIDASNVEVMNIHHIKECLLLSCIASFEDWSNIFRTRSFTLCKNDRDFNDMSDSVTVSESMSASSMTNLSVLCALCEQTNWLFTHKSPRSCFQHFHQIRQHLFFVTNGLDIALFLQWDTFLQFFPTVLIKNVFFKRRRARQETLPVTSEMSRTAQDPPTTDMSPKWASNPQIYFRTKISNPPQQLVQMLPLSKT